MGSYEFPLNLFSTFIVHGDLQQQKKNNKVKLFICIQRPPVTVLEFKAQLGWTKTFDSAFKLSAEVLYIQTRWTRPRYGYTVYQPINQQ